MEIELLTNETENLDEVNFKSISTDEPNEPNELKDKWLPDALVVGSGGARGFMFLGALHRLYAENYLDNVKFYAGVSVGSIFAFFLSLGFNPRQIWLDVKDLDTKELISFSKNFIKNIGLCTMEKIAKRLEDFISTRFHKNITFKQHFEITGNELHILAFNNTLKRKSVFNHMSTPDEKIISSICKSCSIPLFFEQFKDGAYEYTDGALHDPYPLFMVDDSKRRVLGLFINDKVSDENWLGKVNSIITGNLDGKRIESIENSGANCKHICIYSDFLDTTGMTLDANKKVTLMASGDTSATIWIQEERKMLLNDKKKCYLKAIEFYGERVFEESDEEYQRIEAEELVDKETFYHHENYDENFLN